MAKTKVHPNAWCVTVKVIRCHCMTVTVEAERWQDGNMAVRCPMRFDVPVFLVPDRIVQGDKFSLLIRGITSPDTQDDFRKMKNDGVVVGNDPEQAGSSTWK